MNAPEFILNKTISPRLDMELDEKLKEMYEWHKDDDNSCFQTYHKFKDLQITLYPDFESCSNCPGNITFDTCRGHKMNNFKRMTELYRKLENLSC